MNEIRTALVPCVQPVLNTQLKVASSFTLAQISKKGWQIIPKGCFDAYEVKVNKDISKYQEKVKVISQFQIAY